MHIPAAVLGWKHWLAASDNSLHCRAGPAAGVAGRARRLSAEGVARPCPYDAAAAPGAVQCCHELCPHEQSLPLGGSAMLYSRPLEEPTRYHGCKRCCTQKQPNVVWTRATFGEEAEATPAFAVIGDGGATANAHAARAATRSTDGCRL